MEWAAEGVVAASGFYTPAGTAWALDKVAEGNESTGADLCGRLRDLAALACICLLGIDVDFLRGRNPPLRAVAVTGLRLFPGPSAVTTPRW